jgi:hypothetical protein
VRCRERLGGLLKYYEREAARAANKNIRFRPWGSGCLTVVLAVLKLTVAGYWSWWRVMLPFLAFLGHNAVYLVAGSYA